jgi:hypothetical protein
MLSDLRSGQLAKEALDTMYEEAMKARYDASRDTCRKARRAALSEFVAVLISDK